MGRPRKPDHLKIVAGTDQPSRMNRRMPIATKALPSPPEYLTERAAEWFQRVLGILDRMGIASADYVDMLAIGAETFDEIRDCATVVEDCGRTYFVTTATCDRVPRPRPEVAMRNEAFRRLRVILNEFGLSPASVAKVSVAPDDTDNPWAEFD